MASRKCNRREYPLFPDGVDHVVGPNEQPSARRRPARRADVHSSLLRASTRGVRPGGQDDRLAIFADEIDLAVARDRRGGVDAADALLVDALTVFASIDREHADVADHVDEAVVVHE